MARATGPGKGKSLGEAGGFLIYNFDVEGDVIKDGHTAFLTDPSRCTVVATLKAGGSLRLVGLADATGSRDYNVALAGRRMDATLDFLRGVAGSDFAVTSEMSAGEGFALLQGDTQGTPDELFRGVQIFVPPREDPGHPHQCLGLRQYLSGGPRCI
jgi:hypothetical protein